MKTKIHSCARLFALLCVLTLSVGQMSADNYYRIKVVAVYADGKEPCLGKVYAAPYSGFSDAVAEATAESEYTTPVYSTTSDWPDVYICAYDVEDEAYFVGWYTDEQCETPAYNSTDRKSNQWNTYSSIPTTTSEETAPTTTYYAKFNKPTIKWHSLGEVPEANSEYYIYNTLTHLFMVNNGSSSNVSLTSDPAIAIGKTFATNESGQFTIRNSSNRVTTAIPAEGTNEYALQYNNRYYFYVSNSNTISYTSSTTSFPNYKNWIFISPDVFTAQGFSLYYAANAETTKGGTVKVSFAEITEENQGNTGGAEGSTEKGFANAQQITAYYKAIPADGYEFMGWKKTPAEGYSSFEKNYSETYNVTSTESASPTTLTVYAYFEKTAEYEAELMDRQGNSQSGTFQELYNAAQTDYTIVLHKNINLGSTPLQINKNITIDFNNRAFTGTVSNLVTIASGKTVTFVDNSEEKAGGVRVISGDANGISAVLVDGTLNLSTGVIRSENTSTDASAKSIGVTVNGTLNLNGGTIEAKANNNAYGVKNNGAATFTIGTINATATSNAYGVMANGITKVTWSVAINATTTTGNNAVGVFVDNASAKTTIDGGIITVTATAENAYGIWAKNASEAVAIGGNMAVHATAGTSTTAYAVKEDGVAVNVETGRFASNNTQDIIATTPANLKLYGGYYVHEDALANYKANSDVTKGELQTGTKFYNEGYRYILSNGDNPNYVVATANGKKFSSLEDAITYANNNPSTTMTIRLEVPEYTLQAGNYTIPAQATLLLPYKQGQTPQLKVERKSGASSQTMPFVFSKLILETGAQIDVYGAIEVGGVQSNPYKQSDFAIGMPEGASGYMYLQSGSQIVLSSGAMLRAWGYIYGDGTIDARRGAIVKEMFQVLDFCGGTHFTAAVSEPDGKGHRVFPLTQYFIQNIESKTTYHPGAQLLTSIALNPGTAASADDVAIIGIYDRLDGTDDDQALFLMSDKDDSEDTWVCKYYNVSTDQQVYEINNSALLGSLYIGISGYTMNTYDYDLPITNNMQIHLISGEMGITQRTVMLPGAEIIIDKKSAVTVLNDPTIDYDGALFLWDAAQWDKYVFSSFYAQKVKYSATIGGAPTVRWSGTSGNTTTKPASAAINVKGTLNIEGAIYTTEGGANVFSTDADAGTVHFDVAAAEDMLIYHFPVGGPKTKRVGWFGATYTADNPSKNCTSLQLKNASGFTTTKGNATVGTSYCYINGAWRNMITDGCFAVDKKGSTNTSDWEVFAKPQGYVKLITSEIITHDAGTEDEWHEYIGKKDGEGHDTHTYDYVAEWNKKDTFLICMGDCQWWKVVPVEESDTIFHCTHPDNNKYYYWGTEPRTGDEMWLEKKCTVTWVTKPYDEEDKGEVVYNVDYKSTPKYLGTNPSRPMNDYYTYDFTGWTPELEPVTDDAVYTAVFRQNDRKYLISFLDADGSVLEEALWKMGEVPVCKNQPTPSGKILAWEPTIRAVTGDTTYRATYTDEEPSCYEITFVNWDGTTLKKADSETDAVYTVNVGEIPVYDGATPTKPAIADKAFEFDGWTPDLAAVSEAVVYTAKFREKPATYTITFKRAVGDEGVAIEPAETIQTLENVAYGEMPVCTSAQLPTKTSTAAEYYTVVWTPTIAAVTGNATYTATGFAAHKNTCRLTVSAGANGKVALDGSEDVLSAVYEYGNTATVTATATTAGYRFVRWSDGNIANPRTVTVNAAITLKAEFAINQYTITWLDYDDSPLGTTTENYGETPTHAVPARATAEGYSYTFNGWDPAIVPATADATYTATYTSTQLTYTIRIVLNNGMNDIVYNNMAYDQPVAMGTPVKASAGGVNYTFSHWTNSAGLNIGRTIPNVTNNEIYTAQYKTSVTNLVAGNSDAAVTKDLILSDAGMEASALIIEKDGTVTIPTGASVEVQNFILESDGTKSGQLLGTSSARLTVAQHAYFDLTLNTQPRTWYAVAVPWEVDAENGIFIKGGRKLVLGRDFDLVYYNGANRATQGPGAHCWQYVEYETDKTMHPGRAYMMYFAPQIATVRFESKDLTIFDDDIQGVEPHAETTGNDGKDANWNGIGNPKVFHARLAAGGATYGYYLNNGKLDEYLQGEGAPTYKLINLASYTAIVGKPLFIQAINSNSIVATATVAAGAPRRAPEAENYSSVEKAYEVTLHASGSTYEDNIFIQTAEQKEPHYIIGQDLVKAGVNAALPQLWVNRYDTRLAVNTTEAVNGTYDYPLTLNIPQTGEYTISSRMSAGEDPSQNTETLYLTINGSPVWNLSYGAYTATFEKGATTEYGLRITGSNAPQITTGIGNVQSEDVQCTKVLRDGVIYILRGNNVYSIDGQLVK